MDTKIRPIYICCLQETHFKPKDTYRLEVREYKNTFHENGKQKKAGVVIFMSDPEGWDGEGGAREVQYGEHMHTHFLINKKRKNKP